MDTSFVEALETRAKTMLPPATVMKIECIGDATGDPVFTALLEEVEQKGLHGDPLCSQPYETVVFSDRVLLRCQGCPRAKTLPQVAGIGQGHTPQEAHENALYALTLPIDKPNAQYPGCIAAQRYGDGEFQDVQLSCILNRVAYQFL